MSCCTSGLQETFTEDMSRREANEYRLHGLPRRARKLLRAIEATVPLQDKITLEAGLGAGALTIEMLRRGASRATGVDAVATQLASARALAQEFNVADRLELLCADFATSAQITAADVVVLDRVVCCYPDSQALLASAADHTRQVLALSYPRDTWWMRIVQRAINLTRRLKRTDFRFYIHSIPQMHALLESRGLRLQRVSRHFAWDIVVARRA